MVSISVEAPETRRRRSGQIVTPTALNLSLHLAQSAKVLAVKVLAGKMIFSVQLSHAWVSLSITARPEQNRGGAGLPAVE